MHIFTFTKQIESKSADGNGPEKKVTRLAIGVDGGFDPNAGKKFETKESYSIVVLPQFQTIQWPNTNLPSVVSLKCEL